MIYWLNTLNRPYLIGHFFVKHIYQTQIVITGEGGLNKLKVANNISYFIDRTLTINPRGFNTGILSQYLTSLVIMARVNWLRGLE